MDWLIPLLFTGNLLVSVICNAEIIGSIPIPPAASLSGFGSVEVYRGQTFRVPSGPAILANRLTVFVGPTTDSGANFRVLITEVDMTHGFHPTNVIFESETLTVPIFPLRRAPDAFTIDLGGLVLQPGRDYAWILDHLLVGNQATHVDMGTGLGAYADGFGFEFLNGPFFPAGTRADHFASNNWFSSPFYDHFAFQLELSVPFVAFAPKVSLFFRSAYGKDHFLTVGSFTLGDGSDGIDPVVEPVVFSLADAAGTFFTQTLPSGSFQRKREGKLIFRAPAGGGGISRIVISPTKNAEEFMFEVFAERLDLSGASSSPVTVSLQIGNDAASKTISCRILTKALKC